MRTAITIYALGRTIYEHPKLLEYDGIISFFGALICIALVQDITSLYKKGV